jgi:transposase InsO family protein
MNSKRYQQQVLEDVFLDFYTQLKQLRGYVQFQQDNAPAHSSKSTLAWLAHHGIPLFFHPPNSPDLNPIEPLGSSSNTSCNVTRIPQLPLMS